MKVASHYGIFCFAFLLMLDTSARAAGTYSGCAAPPTSFAKALTATPTTFSSILDAAAAGERDPASLCAHALRSINRAA